MTVERVPRPGGVDSLGVLLLRRRGAAVAARVCAAHPGARVVVNGGCAQWADINWVHYLHSAWQPDMRQAPWRSRIKHAVIGAMVRKHERQSLKAARLILANSERTRDDLVNYLGLDRCRVHCVYLGSMPGWQPPTLAERSAARTWLEQPAQRPLAVFVGGFGTDERKGFDTLWHAWRWLCERGDWDVDLVGVGDGRALTSWRQRTAAAGLTARVRLLGATDRVFDLLAAADLLVSPVRYEPYGLNVQEAICRGVPALVSACAGVAERYPPELADAILSDPDDWRELAERLLRWRADMQGWRERFRPLGDMLRSYSWDEMAARIVAFAEAASPV